MAKGGSVSQASQGNNRAGSGGRSASSNLRKRGGGGGKSGGGGGATRASAGGANGLISFGFSDDSPGLKVGPNIVLIMTLVYIAFVLLLHIWSKFR
eukprot:TRINITY_DN13_c0_g1_i1.p1 TRINITY_DN13_c0_g1~~TRINITY_DN13_c0_g1_i1.p1  ORF type:complete len:96 (-),score=24.40 TRINITY_DN13_c0_g1_i1:128-415(-)